MSILLTHMHFYASVSKGAPSTIFYTFGMERQSGMNLQSPALKADALPTELSSYRGGCGHWSKLLFTVVKLAVSNNDSSL